MAGLENLEYKKVEEKLGKSLYERVFNKLDKESKDKVLEQVNNTQVTKDALKDLMRDMLRIKNRKVQFEELLTKGTEKQRKILEGKNIDTISARDLLSLENEETGFLSKTFAYKQIKDESGENIEIPFDGTVKEKDIIKIDFGKNKHANYKIGAGDLLPSSIKVVKIIDTKGVERIGVRSIGKDGKVGYFDQSGYIPVFNGYQIEIPTKDESEKNMKDLSKDIEVSFDEKVEREAKLKYAEEMGQDDIFFEQLSKIDNGENLAGKELENNEAFQKGIDYVSNKLQVKKEDLIIVMKAESGLNPKAINPYSGASGLIQFMPSTAEKLGTTVGEIRTMTSVQQLEYVYRYFKSYTGKLNNATDLYTATFYPIALGKSDDYKMGGELVAKQNQVIAKYCDNPNQIDYAGFKRYVDDKIDKLA